MCIGKLVVTSGDPQVLTPVLRPFDARVTDKGPVSLRVLGTLNSGPDVPASTVLTEPFPHPLNSTF